jgi:CII-binding regulator of phage lambda lysogenization HflD
LNQGSLPDVIEREFEKEVVKEVIVEKEVIIEKPVEDTGKIEELQNEIYILKGKLDDRKEAECSKLQQTLMVLNGQIGEKNETIEKLNKKIAELETLTKSSYAFYMKNSNLKDLL